MQANKNNFIRKISKTDELCHNAEIMTLKTLLITYAYASSHDPFKIDSIQDKIKLEVSSVCYISIFLNSITAFNSCPSFRTGFSTSFHSGFIPSDSHAIFPEFGMNG